MKERLKQLHRQARLDRDVVGSEAFGAALAAIQEAETRANADFDEPKILALVEKEAGKFRESAEAFAKASRQEKADAIAACAARLEALLPRKIDPSAYGELARKAIEETGAASMKDMGEVMALLKEAHGAALDMRLASQAVKEALQ